MRCRRRRSKTLGRALIAGVLGAAALLGQQTGGYRPKPEKLPRVLEPQPLEFSHRVHVEAGAQCLDCHRTADKKQRAGLPQAADCMLCHQAIAADRPAVKRIQTIAEANEPIAWVRAYRVPEFVFFSHKEHLAASVACGSCHGDVARSDVLAQEISTQMTMCMNCHKEREAANDCSICHELGQ